MPCFKFTFGLKKKSLKEKCYQKFGKPVHMPDF